MKLPDSYLRVYWRNTTEVDFEKSLVGFGLTDEAGELIRLAMSRTEARELAETILESLGRAITASATRQDRKDA